MNTTEYRTYIKGNGFTQTEVAKLLGITDRTVRKYCSPNNVEPVPQVVVLATHYLVRMKGNELV